MYTFYLFYLQRHFNHIDNPFSYLFLVCTFTFPLVHVLCKKFKLYVLTDYFTATAELCFVAAQIDKVW